MSAEEMLSSLFAGRPAALAWLEIDNSDAGRAGREIHDAQIGC
jgi:hypothetical protein